MQLDDPRIVNAGTLMQAIDILGNHAGRGTAMNAFRYRPMLAVGGGIYDIFVDNIVTPSGLTPSSPNIIQRASFPP